MFVLVVAGWMYQTYTTIPMYRAQARLQIEEERTTQAGFKDASIEHADPGPYLQTQQRILQGRDLARRAVRRLRLETVPEFNGTGPTPTRLTGLLEAVKAKMLAPFSGSTQSSSAQAARRTTDENRLVAAFQRRVQVIPVMSSRLVDVVFTAADREFAASAVNVLAEEYVRQNLELKLDNAKKTLASLTQELARQQNVVETSERLMAEYRENQNALSLKDRQNIVAARLKQVNEAVTRARTQRLKSEATYRQVIEAKNRDALTAIIQNPVIQNLKTRRGKLERDRVRLLERHGEPHPQVQNVTSQIADARRQIDAEVDKTVAAVKNEYEAALAGERTLTRELEARKDLNRKGHDYSVLQREAQSNRQVYESLLQREKELRVVANSRANNVRFIDRAQVPERPFTPDVARAWIMALLFGLVLGFATAFGIDYLSDTVKTPEDVTWRLKLPFLGLVPKVRSDRHPLLTGPVPHDFGEAFRALRAALVASSAGESTHVIAITSAQPLEGKTTTAVNLALAIAIAGARVLLIDANMRRPSLHTALRLPNEQGLSHLLAGEARIREVVQRTGDPNLLVMTAGPTPRNPSELLASDRMREFVQQLAVGPFDWVIIDTPPVLAVTDAVVLAPLVSSVTFVLGAEMTRWRRAERAIELLQASHAKMVTAVLNRVDFDRNRFYYSRYFGHQYKSYYAEAPAAS